VCAGWGADIEWSKGTVVETSKAAEGLVRLTVDIGQLAKGYTKGGQYLQLKVGESKPGFFAIASAPSPELPIELLVKNQGSTAEILCDSKPGTSPAIAAHSGTFPEQTCHHGHDRLINVLHDTGDEVDVSPVMGKGFPLDRAQPEQAPYLYIFATGTGISPIKALIESAELQVQAQVICSVQLHANPVIQLYLEYVQTGLCLHACRQTNESLSACTMEHSTRTAQHTSSSYRNGRRPVSRYAACVA